MEAYGNPPLRHQLDFTLYNLPATTVRIDFPSAADAETMMLASMPTIQIGASYMTPGIVIHNLFIQPRRIQFEIANPPAQLPITLQIACRGPFVFGWLLVPENVQTGIATSAQRIRIVGPSYWALPLGPGSVVPELASTSTAAKSAEPDPTDKSEPAPTRSATETTGSDPASNSTAAKPAEKGAAAKPGPAPAKAAAEATAMNVLPVGQGAQAKT